MILGGSKLLIGASRLDMLRLCRDRRDASFPGYGLLLGSGTSVNATIAAVVTDAVDGGVVVYDRGVVNVMDVRNVHVVH